jgi:predicted metallopeptidase
MLVAAPDPFKARWGATARTLCAPPPSAILGGVEALNVTLAVKRLVRDVAARLPELSHVRASRVLVVAGEARRASRGTIRPAHFEETRARSGAGARKKPLIRVKGRKILYVITLRPLWFLDSTPRERIATIVHELYHASTRFDGTLHRGRLHSRLPLPEYDRRVRALVDRYLETAPAEIVEPFSTTGLVRARMWLERPSAFYRPGEYRGRRVYTERQLFLGVMQMKTRRRGGPARGPRAP